MEDKYTFKVNFNYYDRKTGTNVTDILGEAKSLFDHCYVQMREELIGYLNPKYEEWNKEYGELYPDKDTGNNIVDLNHYNNFIINKSDPFVTKVNKKYRDQLMKNGVKNNDVEFKLYLNPADDGDIQMKIYFTGLDLLGKITLTDLNKE